MKLHTMVGLGYKLVGIMNLHSVKTERLHDTAKEYKHSYALTLPSASELPASSLHHQPKSPHAQCHDAASWLENQEQLIES